MDDLNDAEKAAIAKILKSDVVQNAMGTEEWDLTEAEEIIVWGVIDRLPTWRAKQ